MQQESIESVNVELPQDGAFSLWREQEGGDVCAGSLSTAIKTHLGQVRAIYDILFSAKINAKGADPAEAVSDNDTARAQSDYFE